MGFWASGLVFWAWTLFGSFLGFCNSSQASGLEPLLLGFFQPFLNLGHLLGPFWFLPNLFWVSGGPSLLEPSGTISKPFSVFLCVLNPFWAVPLPAPFLRPGRRASSVYCSKLLNLFWLGGLSGCLNLFSPFLGVWASSGLHFEAKPLLPFAGSRCCMADPYADFVSYCNCLATFAIPVTV